MRLYRVIARTTGSLQPSYTHWLTDVLYCGYNRLEALRVYHESAPKDYGASYGNKARETKCQSRDVKEHAEAE